MVTGRRAGGIGLAPLRINLRTFPTLQAHLAEHGRVCADRKKGAPAAPTPPFSQKSPSARQAVAAT